MGDSWKWPNDKGGNLNTFPDSLYSNLGKYILQNPTRNQRQMFYLPNTTPLCGILVVFLLIFMVVTPTLKIEGCYDNFCLEVKNYNHEGYEFPTFDGDMFLLISINSAGKICLNRREVNNLQVLADEIIDRCKDYGLTGDKTIILDKIHLKAAAKVPFGTVIDVLKVFRKLGIQNVGLITEGTTDTTTEFFSDYPGFKLRVKKHQDSYSRIPLKY